MKKKKICNRNKTLTKPKKERAFYHSQNYLAFSTQALIGWTFTGLLREP